MAPQAETNANVPSEPSTTRHPDRAAGWRARLGALVCGLFAGVANAIAFEPVGFWPAVLLAPLPLVYLAASVARRRTPLSLWSAFFWSSIGTAPWWAWSHWWVRDVSAMGMIPLVIILSTYSGLFVAFAAAVIRALPRLPVALLAPFAWVAIEYLRGTLLFGGYAWYLAAHPMIESPGRVLAWPATIGGVGLVSLFTLVPVSCAVGWRFGPDRGPSVAAAVLALIAWVAGGVHWSRTPEPPGEVLRAAVIQTNLTREVRDDWPFWRRVVEFNDQLRLTAKSLDADPDVIVWPESSVPGATLDPISLETEREAETIWRLRRADIPNVPPELPDWIWATELSDRLLAAQRVAGVPMIVGSVAYDNFAIKHDDEGVPYDEYDAIYNTTFLLKDGVVTEPRYDKLHLTPFGEVMPYISAFPWLEARLMDLGARGMRFVLTPGQHPTQLVLERDNAEPVRIAAPICFEATDGSVCRRLVYGGGERVASVMINLTDDGWFTDSDPGRRHHLMGARWRCVELATPMVRAANTGYSGLIDARGGMVEGTFMPGDGSDAMPTTGLALRDGVFICEVHLATGSTIFGRTGDVLGPASLGGCTLGIIVGFVMRARHRHTPPGGATEDG